MKFQTKIILPNSGLNLNHENHFLLLGSCFATEIGDRLERHGFPTLANPFGTTYNPKIFETIASLVLNNNTDSIEGLFFEKEELWYCHLFPSQIWSPTKESLKNQVHQLLETTKIFLQGNPVLILTLGTSRVYIHKGLNTEVGNCHKFPSNNFKSEFLTVEGIKESLRKTISTFKSINPELKTILTISPIRHLSDGLIENQRSKARLILAVEEISRESGINYFPSFEILMDELRDYRFYKKDLVHADELAVDVIWEYFQTSQLDSKAIDLGKRIFKVKRGLEHNPIHKGSKNHLQFLKTLRQEASHRDLNRFLKKEIDYIDSLLGD